VRTLYRVAEYCRIKYTCFALPALAMDGGRMTPRALPSQGQPLLGVQAIEPVLPDRPAFAVHQHQQAAVAEAHAGLGEFPQALPERRQRIPAALVAEARAAEARRQPLAHSIAPHQVVHNFTLLDGL